MSLPGFSGSENPTALMTEPETLVAVLILAAGTWAHGFNVALLHRFIFFYYL